MTEPSKLPPFGKSELINLMCLCIPIYLQGSISAIYGPLFPPLAESKGLSPSVYSIVLGFNKALMFILGPIFGAYMGQIGLKTSLVCGILTNGLSCFLFGLLSYVDSYWAFLSLSLLLRGIDAVGSICFLVCAYIVFSILYDGRVATIFGLLQFCYLISLSTSPLLATYIDIRIGFAGTYGLYGILEILAGIFAAILFPNISTNEDLDLKETMSGYWKLLKVPSIVLFIYVYVTNGATADFINTILQPDLQEIGLSEVQIGFTFFALAIPLLATPIWGWLMDKFENPERSLLIGCTVIIVGIILFGPLPFISPSYDLTLAGLILIGSALGYFQVCGMANLRLEINNTGIQQTLLSASFLSIAFLSASSFGGSVSAPIAGMLYDNYGIQNATLFLLLIHIIQAIWIANYVIAKKPRIFPLPPDTQANETTQLLQ